MKRIAALLLVLLLTIAGAHAEIPYTFADREAGVEYLMSNTDYHAGFTQNDLDYRLQMKGGKLEEYLAFAREQVQDFTEEEKALISRNMDRIEAKLEANGYALPELEPIVFIKTTMEEECGAAGYTHGTQIYLSALALQYYGDDVETLLAHELFHCLTRSNPQFRKDMYQLIHFTVQDAEYPLPESVRQVFISNPDVEHHNAWATFIIDGQPVDCFTVLATTKPFENPCDSFFHTMTTGLVPVDGADTWYRPEDAANFDDIFGKNTDYVIDPEECMADNFSYALVYGPDGRDYQNPEIIHGILDYLSAQKMPDAA